MKYFLKDYAYTRIMSKFAGRVKMIGRLMLLILLCNISNLNSQTIIYNNNGSVDLHFNNKQDWEAHKQKIIFLSKDKETADSLINSFYEPKISTQTLIIKNLDSTIIHYKELVNNDKLLISNLQSELLNTGKEESKFEFKGFFAGAGTSYIFDNTNQKTMIDNLINNISINAKAEIQLYKFDLETNIKIPFNKDLKTNLNFIIYYRF